MRLLVVTEKCGPGEALRDGGTRLVATLRRTFGPSVAVAQFGDLCDSAATWHFRYPRAAGDRFVRRLEHAKFVGDRVAEVADGFTHVLFVHVSMHFAAARLAARTWVFPMFLTPSYVASGEQVPEIYTVAERRALSAADRVITPSHLERRQLVDTYGVPESRIRVVPRGVDRRLLSPRMRRLDGPLVLCSVGSIKRQKNTVGLVRMFAGIRARHAGARLRVIGPVQDAAYADEVREEIVSRGIADAVEMAGYVPPEQLAVAVADAHLHLSASTCETFGRAIFETLASGLPNVARATGNAAAEYLAHVPYARFHDDPTDALDAADALLDDLPRLSALATEVGDLFDDAVLARLLAAELSEAATLGVADWDGTLFHKDDGDRTSRCIDAFRRFPARVVCTARPVPDTLAVLREHGLTADWVVGSSGAVVADGTGRTLWRVPIGHDVPGTRPVLADGEVVQLTGSVEALAGLRIETYQGSAFATRWDASKLRAVVRLLRHLDWTGRVRVFGDGRYDEELLAYFDGVRLRPTPGHCVTRQATEVADA